MLNWSDPVPDITPSEYGDSRLLVKVIGTPDEAKQIPLLTAFAQGAKRADDGTAAAPGVAFSSDAASGMFRTVDGVGLAAGGVTRLFVQSDGKAAIGGATPSAAQLSFPGGTLSGGARTVVPIDFQVPIGSQINSQGSNDAVNFGFVASSYPFSQGPTWRTNYTDNVISLASNVDTSLTDPLNPDMPIIRIAMETQYAQGGATDPLLSEFHLVSMLPQAVYGIGELRGISWVVPNDPAYWGTHLFGYLRAAQLQFATGGDGTEIYGQFDVRSSTARFVDWSGTSNGINFRHRFNKNGNAILQQRNAAGASFLDLPFFNSSNALFMGSAGTVVANAPAVTSSITNQTAMLTMNAASGMAANGSMLYMAAGGAITGKLNASYFQMNVSGYCEHWSANTATGGALGYRLRTAAGRQFLEFHDNTGNRHIGLTYYPTGNGSLALDNAQQGGQFANKTSFTVDYATFKLTFAVTPSAPAYQVANVQVIGARNTGWSAMTGTGSKATLAATAAGTASVSYVQAELQDALNRIAALEARLKALDDALFAHGLIGA